jgi:hypothetical protein
MTRSARNLNITILRSFVNDLVEGIFGDMNLPSYTSIKFFEKVKDKELLTLRDYMDMFTSDPYSNPSIFKRKSLGVFIDSVLRS